MQHLLNNKKFRDIAFQSLYAALWLGLVLTCIFVARENLAKSNVVSGFGFLWKSTGWKVGFSLIEFGASDTYLRVLWVGFLNTLFLGIIGLVLATVAGVIIGLARISGSELARLLGTLYVEIFRNVPLIVQVFFWYALFTRFPGPREALSYAEETIFLSSRGIYFPGLNINGLSAFLGILACVATLGLILWVTASRRFRRMERGPRRNLRLALLAGGVLITALIFMAGRIPGTPLIGVPVLKGLAFRGGIRIPPELTALAVSIGIYGGAYIAEIVRGGFQSVSRGHMEAAQALGLSPWQILSTIRFPLAMRAMLPILTNQYIWLIKATTVGIAVSFSDFFMVVSVSINQSGQTLELIGILMGGFLILNFGLAAILNRINRAIALKGH